MIRRRILKVFNRYLHYGGEELSVEKIHRLAAEDHEVIRFPLDSREWVGEGAPSRFGQAWRTVYNPDTRLRLERAIAEHRPDCVMMHNIFPVGSPSLYHAACRMGVPVIQYAHNYRPFAVAGTLYANGRVTPEGLQGNFWALVRGGVWQNSVVKTAILALGLKGLHRSGWLDSVKAWICVSEFMQGKFISAGLPAEKVFGLRHAWEPMENPPVAEDAGYYLFLSRLVDVKGVAVLLRSWKKLHDSLGDRAPELRIGGEGPMEGDVREAVATNPKVRFLGMLRGEEKREVIRRCRAMVVPSVWWEPLGLVTCEAYDYGKPVLAADSGGLTETIQDGVTGFLHKPGDENELVRDVSVMEACSAEQRTQLGQNGRRWLLENAGVVQWKRRFGEILEGALRR